MQTGGFVLVTTRAVAALTGLIVLSGCTVSVPPSQPSPVGTATGSARTMHIRLEAYVSGDGEATVAYEGDPADPDGGTETFQVHWAREFDVGYQDWTALNKVHVSVTELSGRNAAVQCRTLYDGTVGGHAKKIGPLKTVGCHISYGDVGDEEE